MSTSMQDLADRAEQYNQVLRKWDGNRTRIYSYAAFMSGLAIIVYNFESDMGLNVYCLSTYSILARNFDWPMCCLRLKAVEGWPAGYLVLSDRRQNLEIAAGSITVAEGPLPADARPSLVQSLQEKRV